MKIYLVARKGASDSYNLLKNKIVCGDPIQLLVPVGDIAIKFDVDITIKLNILHVEVDGLRVHVHVRDNCTQLNFVFQVLNSNGDWLSPFLEQVLDMVGAIIGEEVRGIVLKQAWVNVPNHSDYDAARLGQGWSWR